MSTNTTTDDGDDLPEPPDDLDFSRLHEYSDEEIEAYNRQKEDELEQRIEEHLTELDEAEQEAVDALIDDAEESIETTTVSFESGLEIEVYQRIQRDAERKVEELESIEEQGASQKRLAWTNCEALAAMCVGEPYDEPEPWFAAYQENGQQWLAEMTSDIIEPARERAEQLGNQQRR